MSDQPIAAIELHHIALPTRREHKWTGLTEPIGGYVLVKMTDAAGTAGWGEAPALKDWGGDFGRYFGESPGTTIEVITRHLAPAVNGCMPGEIAELHARMDRSIKGYPYAKAAVEFAAYDLAGRQWGLSVHRLLGGAARRRIPITHSIGLIGADEAEREVAQVAEEGIRTIKIKVGVDPDRDVDMVRRVRETVGAGIALCVDAVRFPVNGRARLGVASTFLGERVRPGDNVKVYVQKAQHFGLPADPSLPIIMIGPGTGIAPFRAFLYERMASKAPGRNWLFFGHQRSNHDFFYEDELTGMKAAGTLTRLSLAWSRDGSEKFYVQDRMREVGPDLWAWLADGAHVYVCGDAKRMARDVEGVLVEIVATHGARTTDEAIAFVASLKKSGRYQQDVY